LEGRSVELHGNGVERGDLAAEVALQGPRNLRQHPPGARLARIPAVENRVDLRAVGAEVEQADAAPPFSRRQRTDGRVEGLDGDHATIVGPGPVQKRTMRDLIFALRQLRRQPGFTIVALLTLTIGVGATTAIFSVVNTVVLRPLPLPAPDRLVVVYEDYRGRPGDVSAGNYTDVKAAAKSFESLTAVDYANVNLSGEVSGSRPVAQADRVVGARVSASFFDVFGVTPVLGGAFTAGEDEPGRDQVVVLSHRLWTRRFGSDPAVLGQDVLLGGRAFRVIGVMPAAFD